MRSLALDSDGKLYIDATGNVAQVTALDAIVQNCETAMRAQRGEMYFNADNGIPTRGTVWDRYNPLQFIAAGRLTLMAVEGVTAIDSFDIDRSGNTLTYTAVIQTQYGKGTITNG